MATLTASRKATRLLAEQRVMPIGAATVYEVRGDHDTYRVILGTDWAICPCPAHRELCSHVESARLLDDALAADVLASLVSP